MKEIRLHGRGGQGVVKASQIIVKAADIYHGLCFAQYVENMKKAGFFEALEGFGV